MCGPMSLLDSLRRVEVCLCLFNLASIGHSGYTFKAWRGSCHASPFLFLQEEEGRFRRSCTLIESAQRSNLQKTYIRTTKHLVCALAFSWRGACLCFSWMWSKDCQSGQRSEVLVYRLVRF